jgi:transcriptional regulator
MDRTEIDLIRGTLDLLILKTLSWGPMHGVEIVTWLEDRSGGSLAVEDSAIYHALHRMQERGLVRAEWGTSDNNRRARYYELTAAGRDWLREQSAQFLRYAETVAAVERTRSRTA